eukprot:scaffold345227_cov34-Prasinocladus_malaysianus.AAC.1
MQGWGGLYILGQEFTAADILFGHCLDWSNSIGWLKTAKISEQERELLDTYLERINQRPAYIRSMVKRKTVTMNIGKINDSRDDVAFASIKYSGVIRNL